VQIFADSVNSIIMNVFTRRVKEKVRQSTGFTGSIEPTPNDEYMKMLKSCGDFQTELKKTYTKLSTMKSATDEFAVHAKKLLHTALPQSYSESAAASGGAAQQIKYVGGSKIDDEGLSAANMAVSQKLESEVLVPIKKWLDSYDSVKSSVKKVEDLRLEVDSRRHTVTDLSAQVDKYRAKLNKGPDPKVENNMEETIKKLQHKEGKLTLTQERFNEASSVLKNNLEKLITTAGDTKYYMSVAFKEQATAYDAAAKAIGDVDPPTPLDLSSLTIADQDTESSPQPESP